MHCGCNAQHAAPSLRPCDNVTKPKPQRTTQHTKLVVQLLPMKLQTETLCHKYTHIHTYKHRLSNGLNFAKSLTLSDQCKIPK